ncbi:hypothetical protein F5146DRAFT_553387 [Armillaria mellea]|nr:hypothetical protein F5146DRAFT_553387 [Armillaria mellea]
MKLVFALLLVLGASATTQALYLDTGELYLLCSLCPVSLITLTVQTRELFTSSRCAKLISLQLHGGNSLLQRQNLRKKTSRGRTDKYHRCEGVETCTCTAEGELRHPMICIYQYDDQLAIEIKKPRRSPWSQKQGYNSQKILRGRRPYAAVFVCPCFQVFG